MSPMPMELVEVFWPASGIDMGVRTACLTSGESDAVDFEDSTLLVEPGAIIQYPSNNTPSTTATAKNLFREVHISLFCAIYFSSFNFCRLGSIEVAIFERCTKLSSITTFPPQIPSKSQKLSKLLRCMTESLICIL